MLDYSGGEVAKKSLASGELGRALPSHQPWIVAVGSELGLESTRVNDSTTGLPNFSLAVLMSADELPTDWRGYSACDMLVLSSTPAVPADASPADKTTSAGKSAPPTIAAINDKQWRAIDEWTIHGGQAVVSLGAYATQMPDDSPLRRLLPGEIVEVLSNVSTSPLEAATATNVQLSTLTAVRLKNVRGVVELAMLDRAGKRFPWWVRYSNGKGLMHFVGSDLDLPVLKNWKDRRAIWDRLLTSFWAREQRSEAQSSSRNVSGSTYLGYDDLIGQLRATLDYFPQVRTFSFGAIAAILTGVLLIIGPLDYWLSVRWLRRPQASWFISGAVILATSAALIWAESISRPRELLVNSAQIVDFMPDEGRVMVDTWTHIYSSRARTLNAKVVSELPSTDARLDWQGLPGKGLGGMESNLLSDQGMPRYTVDIFVPPATEEAASAAKSGTSASITGVGIPASGTKCLYATWSGSFEAKGKSQLAELKGIDQIEGLLVNPLPYDVLRPVLMYHNWYYSLPSRIRAGEEISITADMVPKDLLRRLNRRQIINSNDVITRWLPEDRQSLDRLLEIMMFYKASGGADYSKLKHRFQPRTDISNVLALDHAVLFGELAKPLGDVQLADVPAEEIKKQASATWCRVLLPVASAKE